MEGYFTFQWEGGRGGGGGGVVFQIGGAPWGASVLMGGGFEKYRSMVGGTPTMGNPGCYN